jgi:autotransporter-associated beta strand protein
MASLVSAQVITESFTGTTTTDPNWVFGGNAGNTPTLTAATGVDSPGNGWLRLTDTGGNQATYAYLDTAFSAAGATVYASFEYATWGGNGADGIAFFLFDGNTTFQVGAPGGSLGYANRNAEAGMAGGYIGVGIDEYGNYSSTSEGKVGGLGGGLIPDAIAVRGSEASGYEFLGGSGTLTTSIDTPGVGTRPTVFNQVQILLTATNQLTVTLQQGGTSPQTVLQMDLSAYARPDTLKLGFTGGTGGLNNNHEVRNVEASTIAASLWNNQGDNTWGNFNNWNPTVVPTPGSDILFDNTYVSSNQTIDVGDDRVVRSITFDAPHDYTLNNNTITFDDQGVAGFSGIAATQTHGTGDHTINSDLEAQNDIYVRNNNAGELNLNGDLDLNSNTVTFDGAGDSTTASGVISGAGDLVKNDAGTVILSGANTYSGGTTLNNGTLNADNATALGSGSVELAGGTLGSTNGSTVGNAISITGDTGFDGITTTGSITQTGDRNVALDGAALNGSYNIGGNTLTADVGTGSSIGGVISNGSLTKEGTGELTLSGSNTYTGATTINDGTLSLGASNVLADATDVSIGADGTLNLNGNSERVGNLTALGDGATLDFGAATGANQFLFDTYTAPPSGVMVINNWESGVDQLASTVGAQDVSSMYLAGHGVAQMAGSTSTIGSLGSGYLITPVAVTYKEWDGSSNNNWGTNNNWTSPGEPTGSQIALFGDLGVAQPNVNLNEGEAFGGIRFDTDATVSYDITGNNYIWLNTALPYIQQFSDVDQRIGNAYLYMGGNTVIDIKGDGDLTISASLRQYPGTASITVDAEAGGGKLILDGVNTGTYAYSGGLFVNSGTVQAQHSTSLGTGDATVSDGATLEFSGSLGTVANNINVTGDGVGAEGALRNLSGTTTFSGNINLTGDTKITADSGATSNYTGNVTGSGNDLTLGGDGAINLNQITTGSGDVTVESGTTTFQGGSANTYTGLTTVEGGTLVLDKTPGVDAINTGGVVVNNSGTLRLDNNNQIDDAAAVELTDTGTFDLNGNSEKISQIDSTSAGTTIALGAGGDLTVGANSVIYSNYEGQITGDAASTFNVDGLGVVYLAGDNSGMAGTMNVDSGTLNVRGNDNVLGTGTTVVDDGGNLQVQGGLNLANDITLNGDGTTVNGALQNISGDNTFTGTVSLGSDAMIASDAGTLSLTGSVALGANGLTASGDGNQVYSGVVSGSGTLTSDANSLLLSGNNTYTGATTVSGGTTTLASDTALGSAAAGTTVDADGTLSLTNNITVAGEAITNNGLVENTSGNNTYGGVMSGTGNLDLVAGTLTLTNTNSYSGDTTIASGTTLTATADDALGTGNTTVNSGGTLALTGGITVGQNSYTLAGTGNLGAGAIQNISGSNRLTGDFTLSGDTTLQSDAGTLNLGTDVDGSVYEPTGNSVALGSNNLTIDGAGDTNLRANLTGTGNLVKEGTGTLVMANGTNPTWSGDTLVNEGEMVLATYFNDAPGVGPLSDYGIYGDITVGDGTGAASSARFTLGTNEAGGATDFANMLAGGVNVTVNSDGRFDTQGHTAYVENVTLDGGSINADNTGASGNNLFITGDISSTSTTQVATIDGKIDFNGDGTKTIDVASGSTLDINARVQNGGFDKQGDGTLILSGSNTFTGQADISDGIVRIDNNMALGATAGSTNVDSGAQLQLDGVTVGNEALTLNGTGISSDGALQTVASSGANSWAGSVTIASASEIQTNAGSTLAITGNVTGSGQTLTVDSIGNTTFSGTNTLNTLNKTGSGDLTLQTGTNTISTVNVNEGSLTVGTSGILSSGLDLNVGSSGTFVMGSGINNTIDQFNSAGTLDIDGVLTMNGGTISGGSGAGSTGELILTSGNTLNITNDFDFGGTLELTANTTLALAGDGSQINIDTLKVTGDTVIDFGAGVATELNLGSLEIAAGTTITVNNWVSFQDLWTTSAFTGGTGSPTLDVRDDNTAQITFNGFDPSDTIWLTFDFGANEITVPEPSTYGAVLMGFGLVTWFWRRRRPAAKPVATKE